MQIHKSSNQPLCSHHCCQPSHAGRQVQVAFKATYQLKGLAVHHKGYRTLLQGTTYIYKPLIEWYRTCVLYTGRSRLDSEPVVGESIQIQISIINPDTGIRISLILAAVPSNNNRQSLVLSHLALQALLLPFPPLPCLL